MVKDFPLDTPGFNPFCDLIGLQFTSIKDGVSTCKVKITNHLLNPHGVVHGGVMYTMADTGMGAALYSVIDPQEICATVQLDMHYFEAVSSGLLQCTTKVVRRTRKLATLESEITSKRNLVAKAIGTYYILHMS
jgi:acyl-CoA thioesterase